MKEPNFKTNSFELYNADNMEIMKCYPDKYFDLAIVDPPYGINASNMTMGSGKKNGLRARIGIALYHQQNILMNYLE